MKTKTLTKLFAVTLAFLLASSLHADTGSSIGRGSGGGGFIGTPITVTGSSSGATLGSDVVVNGTFTGSATGWTLGGGGGAPDWAYSGANTVTHGNGGGTTALQPSTPLTIVSGTVYVVQFTLSAWTAGTVTTSIGGTSTTLAGGSSTAVGANRTYRFLILASSTANLTFTPTTTLVATIDTISVQTLTIATPWLTVSDPSIPLQFYFGTASSRNTFMGQNAGQYASTSAANNVCIGGNACAVVSNTNAVTGVGQGALGNTTNGTQQTAVGNAALNLNRTGIRNTCVGDNCLNGGTLLDINENAGIGYRAGANVLGDYNTFLGGSTGEGAGTVSGTIAIGYSAQPTVSNQAVIGGEDANSAITSFFLGQGVTKVSPGNILWTTTGGSGSNNAGSSLTIAPGAATGTAVTQTNLDRNLTTTTGSTVQVQNRAVVICPSKILSNTSATAQTIATVTTATTSGGSVTFDYTVVASNGTLLDSDSGMTKVAWNNNAGTVAAAMTAVALQADSDASGTLASTPTVTVATNVVSIKVTPTWVTIVPTLVTGYWTFTVAGTDTVACQ